MWADIGHSTQHLLSGSGVPKRKQLSDGYLHTHQDFCPMGIHGDGSRYFGNWFVIGSLRENDHGHFQRYG